MGGGVEGDDVPSLKHNYRFPIVPSLQGVKCLQKLGLSSGAFLRVEVEGGGLKAQLFCFVLS